ncbi:short-chain dehydrogenase/reductase family protein [Nitzschia inconspicua]|uniref:Short-chain dehydrogenase/reductase family protein n=1 Tax=Nitzschia inconspicua TaxID=303405 RepID=A0A9K3LSS1_9STRA|nr:short-chain dehydrogenase/reductase family protein [Nitzschia inconspicua]
MKLVKILLLVSQLTVFSDGWAFRKARIKKITSLARKSLMVGAAGGFVLGTAAATSAALVINEQINNRPPPYEPPFNSLNDKLVLITGGTSGLVLESAKRLGAAGAAIVLTSRSSQKGVEAVEEVRKYIKSKVSGEPKVYSLTLDLDDLSNVKAFPDSFGLLIGSLGLKRIDVLLNNAGVMAIPTRELTVDGYERTFQSNHLGHFVLTAGLFPYLNRDSATVINVSSEAYQIARGGLDITNLNGETSYGAWTSYGQSKLANILFTQELQRRAIESGDSSWLTAVTLHPGAVSTDLGRYLIGEERWREFKQNAPAPIESLVRNALSVVTKTVQEGASTQVYLAAGAEGNLQPGAFYEDCKVKSLQTFATSTVDARKLWEKSEELGGISFTFGTPSATFPNSASTTPEESQESDDDDKVEEDDVEY